MTKLLILGMDGTVREPISGSKFINSPRDQKLIPEAIAAIKGFTRKGYMVIGASNQGGVAAGNKSLDDCIAEQEYTLGLLYEADAGIFGILFCPDYEGNICYLADQFASDEVSQPEFKGLYRKPNAGMLMQAIAVYQASEAIFVGDRDEDRRAAIHANIQFIDAVKWRSSYWIA